MSIPARLFITLFLLVGVLDCAPSWAMDCISSYKLVLVSVVDSDTDAPILGAKISTNYFRLPFLKKTEALTDETGTAILWVNYPLCEGKDEDFANPSYEMFIMNSMYEQRTLTSLALSTSKALRARRPEDLIPKTPDIVFEVTSEEVWARRRAKREEKRRLEEQKAQDLFENSPNFWPKIEKGLWLNEVDRILVRKRWQSVTESPLGTEEDIDAIRTTVIQNMMHPKVQVHQIGWLSPSLVMVSSSWYSTPTASALYTYVLQKNEDEWTVLARYLEFIS